MPILAPEWSPIETDTQNDEDERLKAESQYWGKAESTGADRWSARGPTGAARTRLAEPPGLVAARSLSNDTETQFRDN